MASIENQILLDRALPREQQAVVLVDKKGAKIEGSNWSKRQSLSGASHVFYRWEGLKSGLQAASFPLVAWAGRLLSLRAVDYHVSTPPALLLLSGVSHFGAVLSGHTEG